MAFILGVKMNSDSRKWSSRIEKTTQKLLDCGVISILSSFEFANEIISLFRGLDIKERQQMIIIDEFHNYYEKSNFDNESHSLISENSSKSLAGFIRQDNFAFIYSYDETLSKIRDLYSRLSFMNNLDSEYFIKFLIENKDTQPLLIDMLKIYNELKGKGIDYFSTVLYLLDFKDKEFTNSVFEYVLKTSEDEIIISRENDFLNSIIFLVNHPQYAGKLKSHSINTPYVYAGDASYKKDLLKDVDFYDIPEIFKNNNRACFIKFYIDNRKYLSSSQIAYIIDFMDKHEVIDCIVQMAEKYEYDKDIIISIASDFKEKIKNTGVKELQQYIHYYHSDTDDIYYSLYCENENSLFKNTSSSITLKDFSDQFCGFIYSFIESEYLKDSLNSAKEEAFVSNTKKRL